MNEIDYQKESDPYKGQTLERGNFRYWRFFSLPSQSKTLIFQYVNKTVLFFVSADFSLDETHG